MGSNEKLTMLIAGIMQHLGSVPKVKLAKLVLFSEIEHFNRTGEAITGLYFVRLRKGPVIAFFEETLAQGEGTLWRREMTYIPIYEEQQQKAQCNYSSLTDVTLPDDVQDTIRIAVEKFGSKTGTKLSELSHGLPAWHYSEPNEPIFVAELAAKDESEYFALTDLIEDIDDDDDDLLAKKISRAVSCM